MKNEIRTVFFFPFLYENGKQVRAVKMQSKNLVNMKIVFNYLNFAFHIEVKTKNPSIKLI